MESRTRLGGSPHKSRVKICSLRHRPLFDKQTVTSVTLPDSYLRPTIARGLKVGKPRENNQCKSIAFADAMGG